MTKKADVTVSLEVLGGIVRTIEELDSFMTQVPYGAAKTLHNKHMEIKDIIHDIAGGEMVQCIGCDEWFLTDTMVTCGDEDMCTGCAHKGAEQSPEHARTGFEPDGPATGATGGVVDDEEGPANPGQQIRQLQRQLAEKTIRLDMSVASNEAMLDQIKVLTESLDATKEYKLMWERLAWSVDNRPLTDTLAEVRRYPRLRHPPEGMR